MRAGVVLGTVVAACMFAGGANAEDCMLELGDGVRAAWQGQCRDGRAHGEGIANLPNGTYRGAAKDGRADGHGRLTLDDGGSYVGEWARGKRHGRGLAIDAEGDRHEGEFADGRPHGQGTGWSPEGGRFTGVWEHGRPVEGTYGGDSPDPWVPEEDGAPGPGDPPAGASTQAAARCKLDVGGALLDWSGPCQDGMAIGEGTATARDGATYAGSALNGKPDGFGTVDGPGYYYQGEYRNGVPHGSGIVRGPDGQYHRAEFRDGYQHDDSNPVEGAAAGNPWADWEDDASAAAPGPADGAYPWRDDAGTAVDDPWAPADPVEDPWERDGAATGPVTGGADPVVEQVPSVPDASDFDYSAALDALEDTGATVHGALPADDYTARLSEIEHFEVELRAAEEAREAERRAELQREEERARYEAEQASRRAALEREAVDSWRETDDSYAYEPAYDTDEYESDSSDSTLFGGGAVGQQAFEELLRGNIPSIYDIEHFEVEFRAAEEAREAERRAELQREEERARYEAEQASRRAALERETVDSWRETDDSYAYEPAYDTDEYESDSSDGTLFGGGAVGQPAYDPGGSSSFGGGPVGCCSVQ